jgi:5'-deoxynucleotidase YfbR-like HD superfamily hydrolase
MNCNGPQVLKNNSRELNTDIVNLFLFLFEVSHLNNLKKTGWCLNSTWIPSNTSQHTYK